MLSLPRIGYPGARGGTDWNRLHICGPKSQKSTPRAGEGISFVLYVDEGRGERI